MTATESYQTPDGRTIDPSVMEMRNIKIGRAVV